MAAKPTYKELERKNKKLEKEALEYIHKEKELNEELRLADYAHIKRTISLMKINEELNREAKEVKRADKEKLAQIYNKFRERINELNCLYEITSRRASKDISLDLLLQEMLNFIPAACQYPEITCARLIFDSYDFKTKNFSHTDFKHSFNITVNTRQIGKLEVYRLENKLDLGKGLFSEEEIKLIGAISDSISRIVEREWAEIEIRRYRDKIEELIKQNQEF